MTALVLLLAASFGGSFIAARVLTVEKEPRLVDILALGTALGLGLLAGAGFVLGWAFGLSPAIVVLSSGLIVALGLAFGRNPFRSESVRGSAPSGPALALSLLTFALVVRLADRTLVETPIVIGTGDRHNFGDLPFHMAIAAGFAFADNFPPDHPELAGVPLTYPFFGDVVSGMVLAVGGSWRAAFFWPTLLLGLSVVVAVVRFGESVTGSRPLGRVAAALTFFSGGLGFLGLMSRASLSSWWINGPDATMNDSGLRYANFIMTLFIPQRSILFGWPLLFMGFALMAETLREEKRGEARWRGAGLLISVLPLVHAHSFAVGCLGALILALVSKPRALIPFLQGVTPLAVPALIFMATHNSLAAGRFFEWLPGFDGGADGPLGYWLLNAGLFLPLVLIGLVRARSRSVPAAIAAPFAALFLAANLFRLSPWIWDNMKFLAPAHAGLAPFAALALGFLWSRGKTGKSAAIVAFLAAVLSGALDVSKIAFSGKLYDLFDQKDLAFAENIRKTTPGGAVILTAPKHNHAVLLSGRSVYFGYEGHLWSQGLTYQGRQEIAEGVFRTGIRPKDDAVGVTIDAIALTPAEAGKVDAGVAEGLPSIVDSPYRLLKVR